MFGLTADSAALLGAHDELEFFERQAAVYLPDHSLFVPYPIQNHLDDLPPNLASGIILPPTGSPTAGKRLFETSMKTWLLARFGRPLCELFFFPFHERYTCGLYPELQAQDQAKSPSMSRGSANTAVGYNTKFAYPKRGLDHLFASLAGQCSIEYNARVTGIDIRTRVLSLSNGDQIPYSRLYTTLPLHHVMRLTGLGDPRGEDPALSVEVFNIGARRGAHCPPHHWVYVPFSRSGFHRIGFYSNVTSNFLPESVRQAGTHVSLYVECCAPEQTVPGAGKFMGSRREEVVNELMEWGFIEFPEVVDVSRVGVGYTWSWLKSEWKTESLRRLQAEGITQAGRYGRWEFQGMADSLAEGLKLGAEIMANET